MKKALKDLINQNGISIELYLEKTIKLADLGYDQDQIEKIILAKDQFAYTNVINYHHKLLNINFSGGLKLENDQIAKIASLDDGSKKIHAIFTLADRLLELGFIPGDLLKIFNEDVEIKSKLRGKFIFMQDHLLELKKLEDLGYNEKEINMIMGSQDILLAKTVIKLHEKLVDIDFVSKPKLTHSQISLIANVDDPTLVLELICKMSYELKELGFSSKLIFNLASCKDSSKKISTLYANCQNFKKEGKTAQAIIDEIHSMIEAAERIFQLHKDTNAGVIHPKSKKENKKKSSIKAKKKRVVDESYESIGEIDKENNFSVGNLSSYSLQINKNMGHAKKVKNSLSSNIFSGEQDISQQDHYMDIDDDLSYAGESSLSI